MDPCSGPPAGPGSDDQDRPSLRERWRRFHQRYRRWLGPVLAAGAVLVKWVKLIKLGQLLALLKALKVGKLATTLISMAASIVLYALAWGWQFAVGFVAILLVHEYGHVAFARWRGIPVSGPLFIPFMGAFINIRRLPKTVADEAWLAAGGPVGGLLATTLAWALGAVTGRPLFYALALTGFFMHMFNLLPVSPLDGGRMVAAVSRHIWFVTAPLLLFYGFWQGGAVPFLILWWGWRELRTPVPPGYHDIPPAARWRLGLIYLALLLYSLAGQAAVGRVLGRHGLISGWEEGWLPVGTAAVATAVVYAAMLAWYFWDTRRRARAGVPGAAAPGMAPAEEPDLWPPARPAAPAAPAAGAEAGAPPAAAGPVPAGDAHTLAAAAARAFGLGEVQAVADLGGTRSRHLLVRTVREGDLVVRIHPGWETMERLVGVQTLREYLADRDLPVPRPLAGTGNPVQGRPVAVRLDTGGVAELDPYIPHAGGPEGWLEWRQAFATLGAIHAALAAADAPHLPPPRYSRIAFPAAVARRLAEVPALDAATAGVLTAVRDLAERWSEWWEADSPHLVWQLTHGDYRDAHLLFRDDRLVAVLGFEWAAVRPRVMDVGYALYHALTGLAPATPPDRLPWRQAAGLMACYTDKVTPPLAFVEWAALPMTMAWVPLCAAAAAGGDPEALARLAPGVALAGWLMDHRAEVVYWLRGGEPDGN